MDYLTGFAGVGSYVASFFGPTWESMENMPDWEKFMYLCKYADLQVLENLCDFSLYADNFENADLSKCCVGETPLEKCPKGAEWYARFDKKGPNDEPFVVCKFCYNNLYLESDKQKFSPVSVTLFGKEGCLSQTDNCFVRLLKFKDIMNKTREFVESNEDSASVELGKCREEYQNLRGQTEESADTLKVMLDLLK
jgi:hypothetical protein